MPSRIGTFVGAAIGAALLAYGVRAVGARSISVAQRQLRIPNNPDELRRRALQLGAIFLKRPGDLRFIPAWIASLRSDDTPLSARVIWLPYAARSFIEKRIDGQTDAFEYGAGGSTLWLSRRVRSLTTVEHHPDWYEMVKQALKDEGSGNCVLLLCEPQLHEALKGAAADGSITYHSDECEGSFEQYARAIDHLPDRSLDLVIVDGRSRAACLVHATPKVRPGGLLVLDDSDRERYRTAKESLRDWPSEEFCGLRPYSLKLNCTTVWTRPLEPS